MSGKLGANETEGDSVHSAHSKPMDPRTRYTREILGDALMALIQEKPFEAITIRDVITRAGVGRTTFYTHYADKQDLFMSDTEEFLEGVSRLLQRGSAPSARLVPIQELFTHLAEMRGLYRCLVKAGKMTDIRELTIGVFGKCIEQRLSPAASGSSRPLLSVMCHALAGSLFSMIEWWMNDGQHITATEMDDLFHRLAYRGAANAPDLNPVRGAPLLTQHP